MYIEKYTAAFIFCIVIFYWVKKSTKNELKIILNFH